MADIFISYSRADRAAADTLAAYLMKEHGYTVWWDTQMLSGTEFRDAIMAELDAAKAAIVIWSKDSVGSRYVRDESEIALKAGKLLAAHVPGFDPANAPVGFLGIHSEPLDMAFRLVAALKGRGIEGSRVTPTQQAAAAAVAEAGRSVEMDAVRRLEEIEHWKVVKDSTDPRRFRDFVKRFPDGSFAGYAFERLAELEWARLPQNPSNSQQSWFTGNPKAKGLAPTDDEKALEAFIFEFERTKEAAPARAALKALVLQREEAEWARIKDSKDPDDYRRHLEAFRDGKFEPEATKQREALIRVSQEEEEEWRTIASTSDLARVQAFRKKFANGRYVLAAADREEEVEWEIVERARDPKRLAEFVTKYPKGRFLGAARNALEVLAPEKAKEVAAALKGDADAKKSGVTFGGVLAFLFWIAVIWFVLVLVLN